MDTLAVVNGVLRAFSSYLCHRAFTFCRRTFTGYPSREMARSSVECILIMVNSCNAQPCRRECELFASGSEMYPVRRNIIFTARIRFQHVEIMPGENSFSKLQYFENSIRLHVCSFNLAPVHIPNWKCIPIIIQRVSSFNASPPSKFFNEITKNRSISATVVVSSFLLSSTNSVSINSFLAQEPIDRTNSKRILLFIAVHSEQSPGERVKFSRLPLSLPRAFPPPISDSIPRVGCSGPADIIRLILDRRLSVMNFHANDAAPVILPSLFPSTSRPFHDIRPAGRSAARRLRVSKGAAGSDRSAPSLSAAVDPPRHHGHRLP